MNWAKVIAPLISACARNNRAKAGVTGVAVGVVDEPIYKARRMLNLASMFKRILTLAFGVILGVGLTLGGLMLTAGCSIWPNREKDRATARVREVMALVNENYVESKAANYADLTTAALHGVADSLDPHSEFLEAKDNEQFEEELTGQFGGIGIQVESRGGRIVVIAPIAGTPSERAGIRRGDEIASIDGKNLERGTQIDEVVRRLRGKPQTSVALSLNRAGLWCLRPERALP